MVVDLPIIILGSSFAPLMFASVHNDSPLLNILSIKPSVANQAYPGFSSMRQLGVFLPPSSHPLGGMLAHRKVTPSIYRYSLIHLVRRGTVRLKCLAQEHHTMSWPGLRLGPLDPDSRPLCLRLLQPKGYTNYCWKKLTKMWWTSNSF